MTKLLAVLSDLPPWALEGGIELLACVVQLVRAPDDAAREEALMQGAEAMKRILDDRKFGVSP